MKPADTVDAKEFKLYTKTEKRPNNVSVWKRYKKHKYLFMMLIPVLMYYAIFQYAPIYGIVIAFQDFKVLKGISGSTWVGFENFKELFAGMNFMQVLRNTFIINFYKLLFGFSAPIVLALMLNEIMRPTFKKIVQTISYMPYFLSWVVLSGVVIEFLSPSRGFVNHLIVWFGSEPIFFLASKDWFRTVLVATEIWKTVGFNTIIYIAAIAGINPEMYEASEVDGINKLQKMWYITIPSIAPVIIIMLILSSGQIVNDDFDQVYNLLNGNVLSVGDVLSTYTYREGIVKMNYSYAAAVGLFKNAVALVIVLSTNYLAKKYSEETIF